MTEKFGKQAIKKPSIYIASDYSSSDRGSSLDVAETVAQSPFVGPIFTLEGYYKLDLLFDLPTHLKKNLVENIKLEMDLADIFIIDRRYGDPIEWGYVMMTDKPIIVFDYVDMGGQDYNPVPFNTEAEIVHDLGKLADLNYLKMVLK